MKIKKIVSALLIITMAFQGLVFPVANAATTSTKVEETQTFEGFKLVKKAYSKTLGANTYLYEHVKSGGKVFYVEAKDDHLAMDIVVRTPAKDNSGANHVLEHALLSGSEKYPTKSPFQTVSSNSLSTFSNAITYNGYTCYPFSTANKKDFDNLSKIYLDAIHAPLVVKDENIFKREGWRYSLMPDQSIGYTGVVYNEMKGYSSNPATVHFQGINESLYANTTMANESGGYPENIVDLSYKQLVETYNTYYQPSNMLIYLYGSMDIKEKLAYINQNYWSKVSKKSVKIDYGTPKTLTGTKQVVNYYHTDDSTDTKGIYSMNYLLNGMSKKDMLGMKILALFLNDMETSTLSTDFYSHAFGSSYDVAVDYTAKYPSLSMTVYDTDSAKIDDVEAFIEGEWSYYANTGFNKTELKQFFASRKLSDALQNVSVNKGINVRSSIENSFVLYNDPTYLLELESLKDQVAQEAIKGEYFENLVSKYLVKNTQKSTTLTLPKVGLNQSGEARIKAKLEGRLQKLDAQDMEKLKASIETFNQWNVKADSSENLSKLPTLEIKDISSEVVEYPFKEEQVGRAKLLAYEVPIEGLSDLSLYFDLDVLTEEEIRDLMLFKYYFLNVATKNKSVYEIYETVLTNTAGVQMVDLIFNPYLSGQIMDKRFYVNVTSLEENTEKVTGLLTEIFNYQKFDNKQFAKYALGQIENSLEYEISNSGDELGEALLKSKLSPVGRYYGNSMEPQYAYIKNLNTNFEENYPALKGRLESIYEKLINQNNLVVSYTGSKASAEKVMPHIKKLITSIKDKEYPSVPVQFTPSKGAEAVIIPSPVQYVYKGFNLSQIGSKVEASDLVFASLINNNYMEKAVREQNGAYGGYFTVDMQGDMIFSSYRDPSIEATLKAMDGAVDWIKNQKIAQEDLDPIIISLIGSLNQPENAFSRADTQTLSYIKNTPVAQTEAFYKALLNTTPQDLTAFIEKLEKGMKNASIVVTGSESQINSDKEVFEKIRKVFE